VANDEHFQIYTHRRISEDFVKLATLSWANPLEAFFPQKIHHGGGSEITAIDVLFLKELRIG
jgi:hypothetical protein